MRAFLLIVFLVALAGAVGLWRASASLNEPVRGVRRDAREVLSELARDSEGDLSVAMRAVLLRGGAPAEPRMDEKREASPLR